MWRHNVFDGGWVGGFDESDVVLKAVGVNLRFFVEGLVDGANLRFD